MRREKYYVTNPLGIELWVEDNLIPEFAVRRLVPISYEKAVELKGLGWTVVKQDEDTEAGIAPENDDSGGADNLGTFFDYENRKVVELGSDDHIITYADRKDYYIYEVNSPGDGQIHSVGIEPGAPGERMRLEVNAGGGDNGQDTINVFLAAENAFYDATGTWQVPGFTFEEGGWVELEHNSTHASWKVMDQHGVRGYDNAVMTPGMPSIYCWVTSAFGFSTGAYGSDNWYPFSHINLIMRTPDDAPATAQCNVPQGKFEGQRIRVYVDEVTANCGVAVVGSWNIHKEADQITQPVITAGGCWVILKWHTGAEDYWELESESSAGVTYDVMP